MSKTPDNAGKPARDRGRIALSEQPEWAARQLKFGWTALLIFLSLGIVLETLHGLKVDWYLEDAFNVEREISTRRMMWTLAHAHGTLLSLVQIAFALSAPFLAAAGVRSRQVASRCLAAATLLLPGGFFLGGFNTYGSDPGLGVLLAPIGGFVLLAGVAAIVLGLRQAKP